MDRRHLVTPGPTQIPPEVWRAMSGPMLHHRGPDFQTRARPRPRPAAGGVPHRKRRPSLRLLRDGRDGGRGCEPLLARRPRRRRVRGLLRRALGRDRRRVRARPRASSRSLGRCAERRRDRRPRRGSAGRLRDALRDLHGGRSRCRDDRRRRGRLGRDARRRRGLEPGRRSARDRRLGRRRRRRRLAEGADGAARACAVVDLDRVRGRRTRPGCRATRSTGSARRASVRRPPLRSCRVSMPRSS